MVIHDDSSLNLKKCSKLQSEGNQYESQAQEFFLSLDYNWLVKNSKRATVNGLLVPAPGWHL